MREGEKKHDVPVQVPSSSGKTVEVVQGLASDAPSSISQVFGSRMCCFVCPDPLDGEERTIPTPSGHIRSISFSQ